MNIVECPECCTEVRPREIGPGDTCPDCGYSPGVGPDGPGDVIDVIDERCIVAVDPVGNTVR